VSSTTPASSNRRSDKVNRNKKGKSNSNVVDTSKPYCFVHGHCAHPGSECNVMKSNDYSEAQRQATSSSAVRGGA
jgi:hypothetical protein